MINNYEQTECEACSNIGQWTDLAESFLTCSCGHSQEANE